MNHATVQALATEVRTNAERLLAAVQSFSDLTDTADIADHSKRERARWDALLNVIRMKGDRLVAKGSIQDGLEFYSIANEIESLRRN